MYVSGYLPIFCSVFRKKLNKNISDWYRTLSCAAMQKMKVNVVAQIKGQTSNSIRTAKTYIKNFIINPFRQLLRLITLKIGSPEDKITFNLVAFHLH